MAVLLSDYLKYNNYVLNISKQIVTLKLSIFFDNFILVYKVIKSMNKNNSLPPNRWK